MQKYPYLKQYEHGNTFWKKCRFGVKWPPSIIYCNLSFGAKWPTILTEITYVTFVSSVTCLPKFYSWIII